MSHLRPVSLFFYFCLDDLVIDVHSTLLTRAICSKGACCGLHGSFSCGRLTTVGDLVGMVGSQTSWLQALPCAEGAATDWQDQVTRWLAVESWVGTGLVLPCWWR